MVDPRTCTRREWYIDQGWDPDNYEILGEIYMYFPGMKMDPYDKLGRVKLDPEKFWIKNENGLIRPEGWQETFCNVASDIAWHKHEVIIPWEDPIRMRFHEMNRNFYVLCPEPDNLELKKEWMDYMKWWLDRADANDYYSMAFKDRLENLVNNWDNILNDIIKHDKVIFIHNKTDMMEDLIMEYWNSQPPRVIIDTGIGTVKGASGRCGF